MPFRLAILLHPRIRPVVAMVLCLALAIASIFWIARSTRQELRNWERYIMPFADIDCPPPPGGARADFLNEVQYLSGTPDQVHLLDDDLAESLAAAFAAHPLVAKVEQVQIRPPKQVLVRLIFRQAVLAVRVEPAPADHPEAYYVDEQAILLPGKPIAVTSAGALSSPPLLKVTAPPALPAGQPWTDAKVLAAARTAAFFRRRDIPVLEISGPRENLVVLLAGGIRILWGPEPGAESAGQPSALAKGQWLAALIKANSAGPRSARQYDLRTTPPPVPKP